MRDKAALRAKIVSERARRSGSRSLAAFAKQAWSIFDPAPLLWGWHMDAICEHLEAVASGSIRRLVINVPPRSAKSSLASILFPAWLWSSRPKEQLLFLSYSQELSVEHSVKCRQVIESPWYQTTHARGWRLLEDQNVKHDFANTSGGRRRAVGVTGGITGHGAGTIVIDDPISAKEAWSRAARDQARRILSEAISTRLNDARTGRVVVIMHRLHEDDPSGFLLQGGGWEHLMLPTEFEPERRSVTHHSVRVPANGAPEHEERAVLWSDPRTEPGELLFPERFPLEEVERLKLPNALGAVGFAGQHQQRPAPEEGTMFKLDDWRFWKPDRATRDRLGYADHAQRPRGCASVDDAPARPLDLEQAEDQLISVDATFRETRSGSFVAIHVWARAGSRRCLLYRVHRRMDFTETVRELLRVIEMFPRARRKLVEGKANGDAIISTLSRSHGVTGLEAVPVAGSKEQRAHAMQPYHAGHNVELPEGAPWLEEYVAEHAAFPNGSHDDDVDAQSQGLQGLERSVFGGETVDLGRDRGHRRI
jgi:predicted phage terminase large subunit-like protein